MVSKLTKNPENRRTGMAVTGPTKVATCAEKEQSVSCQKDREKVKMNLLFYDS